PPAGQVDVVLPDVGQKERRALAFVAFFVTLFLPNGGGISDAFSFGRVAAQFAKVLSRPLLHAERLIAPCRAGARINSARVLENVGLLSRPLHFDRFTILQVRHAAPFHGTIALRSFASISIPGTLRRCNRLHRRGREGSRRKDRK